MLVKTWNEIAQMKDDGFVIRLSIKSVAGTPMTFEIGQDQINFRLKYNADDEMYVDMVIADTYKCVFIC